MSEDRQPAHDGQQQPSTQAAEQVAPTRATAQMPQCGVCAPGTRAATSGAVLPLSVGGPNLGQPAVVAETPSQVVERDLPR